MPLNYFTKQINDTFKDSLMIKDSLEKDIIWLKPEEEKSLNKSVTLDRRLLYFLLLLRNHWICQSFAH